MSATAAASSAQALELARAVLRGEQRVGPPVTEAALEHFREQTRTVPDETTGRWRRGPFSYLPELEAQRIARGEELIRRVDPGPDEDPGYFAMLAYQAASLELVQRQIAPVDFSGFLLGTAHLADLNAFSDRCQAGDFTVVVVHSGLVDFVYQAAKAIVEATHPVPTGAGERGLVKATTNLDLIRAGLAANPAPIERLYRTLAAYFFDGYPRATAFEPVPAEQQPSLALIVSLAERSIIGHEYGHGEAPAIEDEPGVVSAARAEEWFADVSSMVATVLSADELDAVPPEFPLGGAIFALACLELRQRGFYVLRIGEDRLPVDGPDPHPPPRTRAAALIEQFRCMFDVEYHPDHTHDLWFRPKPQAPPDHGFTAKRAEYAYTYANILMALWDPVRDRLLEDYRNGRKLHPLWQ